MPYKPATVCKCGGLRRNGTCNRCGPVRRHSKPTPEKIHQNNVLYGRRWRRKREHQLLAFPLCHDCATEGIVTAATEVHHLMRHNGDTSVFWSSPLLSLCESHHSRRSHLSHHVPYMRLANEQAC